MRHVTVIVSLIVALVAATSAFPSYRQERSVWSSSYRNNRTIEDVMQLYGDAARNRLDHAFARAGVAYPPGQVALVGLKTERLLEVWAWQREKWQYIKKYRIRGASGEAGPKLFEGDKQVPEGVYRITRLNPNSNYHLSMKLDYPNAFDLRHAREDGRSCPGGDIFIHGKTKSLGCLAMGDEAIEELFILVAEVGKDNTKVVIAPHDPRKKPLPRKLRYGPLWIHELYRAIEREFRAFRKDGI